MAETRKHNPRSSSLGDQVRAAIRGVPRPNPLDPQDQVDPFFVEPSLTDTAAGDIVNASADPIGGYTLRVSDREGLVSITPDQLSSLYTVVHSDDRTDDDWDDDELTDGDEV